MIEEDKNLLLQIVSKNIITKKIKDNNAAMEKQIAEYNDFVKDTKRSVKDTKGIIEQLNLEKLRVKQDRKIYNKYVVKKSIFRQESRFYIVIGVAVSVSILLIMLNILYSANDGFEPITSFAFLMPYIMSTILAAIPIALTWWLIKRALSNAKVARPSTGIITKEYEKKADRLLEKAETRNVENEETKNDAQTKVTKINDALLERIESNNNLLSAIDGIVKKEYTIKLNFEDMEYAKELYYYIYSKRADSIKDALNILDARKNDEEAISEDRKRATNAMYESSTTWYLKGTEFINNISKKLNNPTVYLVSGEDYLEQSLTELWDGFFTKKYAKK